MAQTLGSTTHPGATRAVEGAISSWRSRRRARTPGNQTHNTPSILRLVSGVDPASAVLAVDPYAHASKKVISVASAEVAESAKLLENICRAVNIALLNEIKIILAEMDIDI